MLRSYIVKVSVLDFFPLSQLFKFVCRLSKCIVKLDCGIILDFQTNLSD